MVTTPSAASKTCTLRADAPVFVPRERSETPAAGFKFNPQASEYKPSKDQQAFDQLFGTLTETSISERSELSDGSAESAGQCSEGPVSVASSPGRSYAASTGGSSSGSTLVDNSTGTVGDGTHRQGSPGQSPRYGVLHHHHIHHHLRCHLLQIHRSLTHNVLARIEHAEFVGSLEHLEHASHAGPNHAVHTHAGHVPSSGNMHIQPHGATHHVPYRPYPAPGTLPAIPPGTPVMNYRPIPCEAYLLDHPLRDVRTGHWEVPAAQPIRHRYTEADLALFRSTHKEYKIERGIPLYAAKNGSQANGNSAGNQGPQASFGLGLSLGQTMAREYHAQNTYEYRNLKSTQNVYGRGDVYGRGKGFWYGWY